MSEILRRSIMLASEGLPAEYERLVYLRSDTRQIIKTGIYSPYANKFKFGAQIPVTNNNTSVGGYAKDSPYYRNLVQFNSTSGNPVVGLGGNSYANGTTVLNVNQYYDIESSGKSDNPYIKVNGVAESLTITGTPGNFFSGEIYTFAINVEGGRPLLRNTIMYYLQIYSTDQVTLLADLICALRKSDNEPGMYDLKRRIFITNGGTGKFGYKKLDGTIVNPSGG